MFTVEAPLPAVISVTEKINEPRFPSFKGIMAAKKKEVTTLTLAEIGVEADEVGVANAGSKVLSSTPKPPKTAGEKITDEGEGGKKIAAYLVAMRMKSETVEEITGSVRAMRGNALKVTLTDPAGDTFTMTVPMPKAP